MRKLSVHGVVHLVAVDSDDLIANLEDNWISCLMKTFWYQHKFNWVIGNFMKVIKSFLKRKLTLKSFRSASLPFITCETKNPVPNSRPPLNENPYVDVTEPSTFDLPAFECGRTSFMALTRESQLRDVELTSLELVESCILLLQSVMLSAVNNNRERQIVVD